MKISIERHAYAPELNRIFLNGILYDSLDCSFLSKIPRSECIKAVRLKLFKRGVPFKYATISAIYKEPELIAYNRTYNGTFKEYTKVAQFIRDLKVKHNAGEVDIKAHISQKYI